MLMRKWQVENILDKNMLAVSARHALQIFSELFVVPDIPTGKK